MIDDELTVPQLFDDQLHTPRQAIYEAFYVDLPIHGGWGYTRESAVIIEAPDISISKVPFNLLEIQYEFVPLRIYKELVISKEWENEYGKIDWKLLRQSTAIYKNETFDVLEYKVTGIHHRFLKLMAVEFGYETVEQYLKENPELDEDPFGTGKKHSLLVDALRETFIATYWFNISSITIK